MESNEALYRVACSRFLRIFIREAFSIVNPGTNFADNWHVDVIAEYLEAVTRGEIKRLIINIPPRSLKSTCISVVWPAWLLGNAPERRIICSSYSQALSNKLSLDCRHLMRSSFFHKIFPEVAISSDQNQKNKFLTNMRGFRLATSTGGTITGEGGNFLIVDDPHNALEVNSPRKRQNATNWFQQSFSSRLDDKKTGVIVIVMQRLHVDDLTGFLLANQRNNWHLLNIPAIAPRDIVYQVDKLEYLFKEGELLHNEREGPEEIRRIKSELGSHIFSAQYLQDPVASESGMVKKNWLRYYESPLAFESHDHIIQSWDTAIKSGDENSYSVCTSWSKVDDKLFLLDVYREKLEYPDLKRKIISSALKWNADLVLIEDKASGQSLLQDLKHENRDLPLAAIKVKNDKICRFARVTALFEDGKVLLNKNAVWLDEYEKEILSFPHSKHSDQVDSTSQYLQYVIFNKSISPRLHRL